MWSGEGGLSSIWTDREQTLVGCELAGSEGERTWGWTPEYVLCTYSILLILLVLRREMDDSLKM